MKSIANALIVVALVCACLFAVHGLYLVRADIKAQAVTATAAPAKSKHQTIALRPSESLNLPNRTYRKIEVRSTFPVRVVSGNCHSDYTVDLQCEGIPSEIFITDARTVSTSGSQASNTVDIVGTEF